MLTNLTVVSFSNIDVYYIITFYALMSYVKHTSIKLRKMQKKKTTKITAASVMNKKSGAQTGEVTSGWERTDALEGFLLFVFLFEEQRTDFTSWTLPFEEASFKIDKNLIFQDCLKF